MNVYTYYNPLSIAPDLWAEEDQRKLIDVWARSWRRMGWNPVVLSEADAQKHPRYAEFKKRFWELPTEYGHDYEGQCFMRWAAVSAAGGGLMVDYDVINYSFAPTAPDPQRMQILCDSRDAVFLGAVLAPYELFEGMCQLFFSWDIAQRDWNPNANPPMHHCSDLTFCMQAIEGKSRPCPDWLYKVEGCSLYPRIDRPLVHYGYAVRKDGYWPKWQHIEKIRPFAT